MRGLAEGGLPGSPTRRDARLGLGHDHLIGEGCPAMERGAQRPRAPGPGLKAAH